MIEININNAIDELREVSRDLSAGEFKRAVRMGLNDGIRKSRTLLVREIISNFNNTAFTPSGVRSAISLSMATNFNLTSKLGISGKPIALAYFGARKTQTGVSVEIIRGQRKVVKSAFMVKVGGRGKAKPFARGQYEGNQFKFRKERVKRTGPDMPISKLLSVSIPSAVRSNDVPVLENVAKELEPYTMQRIQHHVEQVRLGR